MPEGQTGIKCVLAKPLPGGFFEHLGERIASDELPIGAMWDATWKKRKGFDGRAICVLLPGRYFWSIDSRCSNCSKPKDESHRCWIRHGEPPDLTVDKNGDTCSAGAGSIIIPGWHGFCLRKKKGINTVLSV